VSPPQPGLYLHVPFCSSICPYCEFAVTRGGAERRTAFVDAAVAESALWRGRWTAGRFDTLYLGGGTPSQLDPAEVGRLLDALRTHLPVDEDAWITLEANPEDASAERLAALRDLGVSGLSLGVQSFDPTALKSLGRRHGADEARRAVERALAAGFPWVSLDLIFGLPADRRSPDALAESLETTVALAPHHVSCYQLTFHEGTPYWRGRERGTIRELPEAAQASEYETVLDVLGGAGYTPYEVSNFARATGDGDDHRSRHNRKYWRHVPYLGLGPSAHSFDGGRRWWNERDEAAWRARVRAGKRPVAGEETLGENELALEALMLGLRTAEGVDLAAFRERYGVDLVARNEALLGRLTATGLVTLEAGHLRPTLRGFAVADGLPAGFDVTSG